jgi:hypothetical protein
VYVFVVGLNAEGASNRFSFLYVPACEHERGALPRERERRRFANTVSSARYKNGFVFTIPLVVLHKK